MFLNLIFLQAPETDNAGDLIGGTEDVGGPETNGYEDVWWHITDSSLTN